MRTTRSKVERGVQIVGVAIKDENGKLHTLAKPNRHHHLLKKLKDEGLSELHDPLAQGFIDEEGDYLNRHIAHGIATRTGQAKKTQLPSRLLSEDLW